MHEIMNPLGSTKVATPAGFTWSTYTPTWTASGSAPAIGNGTSLGYWTRSHPNSGAMVWVSILFTPGGTSTFGTGTYYLGLPVSGVVPSAPAGGGYLYDSSAGRLEMSTVFLDTASRIAVYFDATTNYTWAATQPWTWATGDQVALSFFYEAL